MSQEREKMSSKIVIRIKIHSKNAKSNVNVWQKTQAIYAFIHPSTHPLMYSICVYVCTFAFWCPNVHRRVLFVHFVSYSADTYKHTVGLVNVHTAHKYTKHTEYRRSHNTHSLTHTYVHYIE